MPFNLKLTSEFAFIFIGLILLLYGFVEAISASQTNTNPFIYIVIATLGFGLIAYVFANER